MGELLVANNIDVGHFLLAFSVTNFDCVGFLVWSQIRDFLLVVIGRVTLDLRKL